ncbi:MAG: YihY/virulence factor BrkB family protein [Devosia sp.]|nr:YihY/virulence factor BrkB family protein [Devosia sp.]
MSTDTNEIYARQRGRGRQADAPTKIPPSGWKDILWRLYRGITQDHTLLTAAGVTFYLLLALVPTLSAFVSIYGLFNDRSSVLDHIQLLSGLVPPGGLEILRDQLTRLTAKSTDTLGATLIVSLAIALWSASAGVKAMFEAMNVAYHEQERRSFVVFNGLALLFTFGGAIAAVLVLSVVLLVPVLLQYLPGGEGLQWTIRVFSYLAMLGVLSLGIAALYRWGASRQQAKWRWITPGAIFAVLALGLTSVAFSWYVTNFNDNTATYGSLGAVIGLMTWLWISTTLVLIGAELNSEIEHQTAEDSTTGEEQPLGERGAHMADNVGRVWPLERDKVEHQTAAELAPKPQRKQFSLSALVFAAPAALLLRWADRRKR